MLWNLTGSRLHCKEKNVCPETPVENHSSTFLEKRLGTASTCLRGWSLAGLSIDAPCDITKGPFTEQWDLWHNTEKNGANDRSKGRTSQFCVGELEASYRTKFDIVSSSVKLLGKMYGLVTLWERDFFFRKVTHKQEVCVREKLVWPFLLAKKPKPFTSTQWSVIDRQQLSLPSSLQRQYWLSDSSHIPKRKWPVSDGGEEEGVVGEGGKRKKSWRCVTALLTGFPVSHLIGHDSLLGGVSSRPLLCTVKESKSFHFFNDRRADIERSSV